MATVTDLQIVSQFSRTSLPLDFSDLLSMLDRFSATEAPVT